MSFTTLSTSLKTVTRPSWSTYGYFFVFIREHVTYIS